ncbi:hypothetical protein P8C59_004855 [Phyllachora maydis]|uniref:Uncharacterized protein n=1 Tax=Phyllachora maydis TaxID=1825666 RepID=A0AAD9I371_9PEZI|nr:hypothetical protein P8C59_004855 [Phyllachora maydis]
MYTYIACSPCRRCYCDSSFTNLLIANTDSFSNSDNLVYTILAPTPTKLAKIMLAIRRIAAYKAKRRKVAKAYAAAAKKEGLRRSKHTAGSNTGRYTTDSGLTADKDDNNAYNRAYIPSANIEKEKEEEGSSSDNDSVNSSTSDSANKGEGSSVHKRGEGSLRYKDIPPYKRQRVISYPYSPPSAPYADIYVYYIQAITAGKSWGPNNT